MIKEGAVTDSFEILKAGSKGWKIRDSSSFPLERRAEKQFAGFNRFAGFGTAGHLPAAFSSYLPPA